MIEFPGKTCLLDESGGRVFPDHPVYGRRGRKPILWHSTDGPVRRAGSTYDKDRERKKRASYTAGYDKGAGRPLDQRTTRPKGREKRGRERRRKKSQSPRNPQQPRLCTTPCCRDVTVTRCDPCDTAEGGRGGRMLRYDGIGARPTATAEGQLLFFYYALLLFILWIYPSEDE